MRLSDEKNLMFMNDKNRLAAEERLQKAKKHIREIETLSAQTILVLMPPALKELQEAYDSLITIEAKLEYELGQNEP